MEKKKTVPEVETVTITMSRPVAEAVKIACEWYLRLHMGQFWDMADDLCMEKFYSDLENNVYETNEQRANAFDVALHRRDTMREEMEKLYNRCVLPAPISDVMKIPYRAEMFSITSSQNVIFLFFIAHLLFCLSLILYKA